MKWFFSAYYYGAVCQGGGQDQVVTGVAQAKARHLNIRVRLLESGYPKSNLDMIFRRILVFIKGHSPFIFQMTDS